MSIITSEKLPIITEERSPPASPRYDEADLIGRETDDFVAKIEREVVIVPNCTYSNEAKSASKYFLCTCSTSAKGFDLICEACAKFCHKKHSPTLEVPGANLCSCGLNNHIITPEMKAMYDQKQKGNQERSVCFYSKFFKVIPNKGFFQYNEKIYCSVCVQYCLKLRPHDVPPEFY